MKKSLFTLLFLSSIFSVKAQVNVMWATRYTSNGNNVDRASAMVTDASGNLYVTGIGWGLRWNRK